MGYTFDVEIHDTKAPMVVDLELDPYTTQTLTGCIVFDMDKATTFSVAKVSIIGQVGVVINAGTSDQAIAHESLLDAHQAEVDLIAANDTNGDGKITLEAGRQYLPFRIDIRRAGSLPPTLVNKLDTPYIDWRYHLVVSVKRDWIFSTTSTIKRELIMRRQITPIRRCDFISASTDRPKKFRSRFTIPSTILLGQDSLTARVELKARDKGYLIREVDCSIIQVENIAYETRRGHPIKNAGTPGYKCKIEASRIVSPLRSIVNEKNDMDFGRDAPLVFTLPIDNLTLLPTERGLGWLDISHKVEFKVHFMDVNLPPVKAEMPLFVGHSPDEYCHLAIKPEGEAAVATAPVAVAVAAAAGGDAEGAPIAPALFAAPVINPDEAVVEEIEPGTDGVMITIEELAAIPNQMEIAA
ncbi:hypothetical protein BGW41_002750 [Actinomortierella wolfii]|nr:hypothetical protein BGW41_002750 [Actinomortierella wolfii]